MYNIYYIKICIYTLLFSQRIYAACFFRITVTLSANVTASEYYVFSSFICYLFLHFFVHSLYSIISYYLVSFNFLDTQYIVFISFTAVVH